MALPPPIEPDTKDWTWLLERPCPECGFVAADVPVEGLAEALLENATAWVTALAGPGVTTRPSPAVWSVLEYACHVRDVHRVFGGRVHQLLTEDEPCFANWDQDASALEDGYAAQDPGIVGPGLLAAAAAVAERYAAVPSDAWGRRGTRSNGSEFTVASLGRYHLHDVVHHLHDIEHDAPGAGADG